MRIYRPLESDRALNTMFISPANLPGGAGVSEWVMPDGSAIMLTVEFRYGVARVPSNLARIMVDNDLASFSPLVIVSE